ncbi:efflux RND transporter periplasmic adaptor subunit [candidate division FCPU426 bacterium]|nr:efflux RND transporter periplasmic adaptor subunit [candidate division FCPU426 bacterium]
MKAKWKWVLWGLAALVVLLAGYRIIAKVRPKEKKVETAIAVQVQAPVVGEALNTLELAGTITAKEEANAYSKVPGKLARYVKTEGQWVQKDDILAWVERDEIGLTYSLSPVKAPIAGLVAERFMDIGESVTPAGMGGPGMPVARVVNPANLELTVYVVEKEISRLQVGQEARIRVQAYPGEVFGGKVERISPVVNQTSRTTQVKIRLASGRGRLKSGMLADVAIIVGRKEQALLLPRDAVLKQNRKEYVYVVNQGAVARRDLETGWLQQDTVEIISGLQPDEKVIVRGQTRVTEGMKVQIVGQEE